MSDASGPSDGRPGNGSRVPRNFKLKTVGSTAPRTLLWRHEETGNVGPLFGPDSPCKWLRSAPELFTSRVYPDAANVAAIVSKSPG